MELQGPVFQSVRLLRSIGCTTYSSRRHTSPVIGSMRSHSMHDQWAHMQNACIDRQKHPIGEAAASCYAKRQSVPKSDKAIEHTPYLR